MSTLFAGIEAGGTKFICAVGSGPGDVRAQATFATTTPDETMQKTVGFLRQVQSEIGTFEAIGIASFGPVDPNPTSPTYGYITTTPKPGWANFDFRGAIQKVFDLPIGFDTDVNGAALGEWRWGAARDVDTFIYLTIGTGIGGGVMTNGGLVHGLIHPEMGHICLPHDWQADPFAGNCPFHGDCLEGMAAGPAMEKRWGQRAETLPEGHPAWELEAHYLGLGLMNFICTLSPQRIVIGGGVMSSPGLFPLVRGEVQKLLNGYVQSPMIIGAIDDYIVPPALGSRAGVLGAIALAGMAFEG